MGDWKRKWAAFRQELARRAEGKPRLCLVKPRRASGPIPRLPADWHEESGQQRLFGLAMCKVCQLVPLPGEPMVNGVCGPCRVAVPEQPPAA